MSHTASISSSELTVERVAEIVMELMEGAPDGVGLDTRTAALVAMATRSCATTLDLVGVQEHLGAALDAGVTAEQIQQMLVLVSGIGIHGLIATSTLVAQTLRDRRHPAMVDEYTEEQADRWRAIGGGDAREARIAGVAPDFLPNLVRLSSEQITRAVMDFRAAPWAGTLEPLQLEFIGIAVDSMPSHRFLPTLRVHVNRARELGAGRVAIRQVLDIAAATPNHRGVW